MQTTLIERSIVSSRVALLLRSAEIKLLFSRFVFKTFPLFPAVKETFVLYSLYLFYVLVRVAVAVAAVALVLRWCDLTCVALV